MIKADLSAYIPSVTNFLADVTMCRAATAAPCLGGTSAAPFLGAHDPVGHFLWYKTPPQTPISTGPGSRVGTLTEPPYWTVWVRATAPLMTLLHEFYDWVWPIRVDEDAGLTLDLEYLTWDCNIQNSRVPESPLPHSVSRRRIHGKSSITQLRTPPILNT